MRQTCVHPEYLLEPGEEGVIVATEHQMCARHYDCRRKGRVYLWYVGKPRKIYEGDPVRNIFVHDGRILALTEDKVGRHHLQSICDGEILFTRHSPTLEHVVEHNGKLYATLNSFRSTDGYYSDVGTIENQKFVKLFEVNCVVRGAVSLDKLVLYVPVLRERNKPDLLDDRVFEIHLPSFNGDSFSLDKIYERAVLLPSSSLGTFQRRHALGRVAAIDILGNHGTRTQVKFDALVADQYAKIENFVGRNSIFPNDSDEQDALILETADVFSRRGLPFRYFDCNGHYHLNVFSWLGYAQTLDARFGVSHFSTFNNQLVYACNKQLYVGDNRDPVWAFRDRISGLLTVTNEILKPLKEKASVRRGRASAVRALRRVA